MVFFFKRKKRSQKNYEIAREKYKGRLPPFRVVSKLATHKVTGQEGLMYKEGSVVAYKDKIAVVDKVDKNCVYLIEIREDEIDEKGQNRFFVNNEDYLEHGVVYPVVE